MTTNLFYAPTPMFPCASQHIHHAQYRTGEHGGEDAVECQAEGGERPEALVDLRDTRCAYHMRGGSHTDTPGKRAAYMAYRQHFKS